MQIKTNTDVTGGIVVLAISAYFLFQLDEELTEYGAFFPKGILPLLVLAGAILLVRGLSQRSGNKKLVFQINGTMALAMVVGAFWAGLLKFLGFIAASFLALAVLVMAYLPKDKRNIAGVLLNWACTLVCVLLFYFVFTHFLGVTLPAGSLF